MVGTKLAHYEITAHLGSGGMGDVYQASDSRLKRSVALKFLPQEFARDGDRLARFEREARVLAALNHPNIAAIHGLEQFDGRNFLVMELVDGETLAERIAKGPIVPTEALSIAKQIAEALEAAHEKGIVHRDLKPANVKVSEDGTVKVLDFGLSTAVPSATGERLDSSNSPTLTMAGTQTGVILGTAAYMSPEQAAGKTVDRRADIWSFGVVLWEMLLGRRLFEGGETVSHTLADVLRSEIDFQKLPRDTPLPIRELIRRCLDRDVKTRLRDIGEARVAIQGWLANPTTDQSTRTTPRLQWIALTGWVVALIAMLAVGAFWYALRSTRAEPRSVVRFSNTLPIQLLEGGLSLSRDGTCVAFVSGPEQLIYVRTLDQLEAKPLAGTEGARFLSFSPDGQWISFTSSGRARPFGVPSAQSRVKKVALAGGAPQNITDAPARGIPPVQRWGDDDYILFTTDDGLHRVSSAGGPVQTITKADSNKGERFFDDVQLLPGGHSILASISKTPLTQVAALNSQTGERKVLLERAGIAHYVPDQPGSSMGYIIYFASETGSLMTVPFDAARLEVKGTPVSVLEGVRTIGAVFGAFGLSENGTLAYVPGGLNDRARTLVWVDRQGVEQPVSAPPRHYNLPRLSPDGTRIAVEIQDPGVGQADVWLYDLSRATLSRLTFANMNLAPLWMPDGTRVVYASGAELTRLSLVSLPADTSSPPSVLLSEAFIPDSISPDGKLIIQTSRARNAAGGNTVTAVALADSTSQNVKPQIILDTPGIKTDSEVSPNGRLIAYSSTESGRSGIYVQEFPGPGGKWTIADGGTQPRWARSGKELFYRSGTDMMAVAVELSPTFRAGKPQKLFEGRYRVGFDVAPDSKNFLMIKEPAEQAPPDQLHIVVNWFEEIRRRVPIVK